MSFSMSCKLPRLRHDPPSPLPLHTTPPRKEHPLPAPSSPPSSEEDHHHIPSTPPDSHVSLDGVWERVRKAKERSMAARPSKIKSLRGSPTPAPLPARSSSLTNRASGQQNYEKGNPSKTPCIPPIFPPTHHSRFPSRVPYQPQSAPHILGP